MSWMCFCSMSGSNRYFRDRVYKHSYHNSIVSVKQKIPVLRSDFPFASDCAIGAELKVGVPALADGWV